jgi:transcriptional regulator with XRE-family HTH domain
MALKLVGAMPAKKPPLTEFGRRLTTLRQSRGLTQVQLAQAIGSTQRIISRLETVAEHPTVPLLIELARALKVSADELLGLRAPPKTEAPVQLPEERRLWKKLRRVAELPERDQRAVLRIIDSATLATAARRSA